MSEIKTYKQLREELLTIIYNKDLDDEIKKDHIIAKIIEIKDFEDSLTLDDEEEKKEEIEITIKLKKKK